MGIKPLTISTESNIMKLIIRINAESMSMYENITPLNNPWRSVWLSDIGLDNARCFGIRFVKRSRNSFHLEQSESWLEGYEHSWEWTY